MCGIYGYIGKENATPIILKGLKQLEYRGYDSAGIAIRDGVGLHRVRSVGGVDELMNKVNAQNDLLAQSLGIGHTRWATHGKVCEANAHPHSDCKNAVSIVHNGIIENYRELKQKLHGHEFTSDTDTEVVAHLLEENIRTGMNSRQAVEETCALLKGTYALLILTKNSNALYVAVNGSPLFLGKDKSGNIHVSSDARAFHKAVVEIAAIPNGSCGEVSHERCEVLGITFEPRVVNSADIQPRHYSHHFRNEMGHIPEVIDRILTKVYPEPKLKQQLENMNLARDTFTRIRIVACGTAYFAGLTARNALSTIARVPVEVEQASSYVRRFIVSDRHELVIALSQSGETKDTIAAVEKAKQLGSKTLALVNVDGSLLTKIADAVLLTHAGQELSVASTKAYCAQIAVLTLCALAWAVDDRNARAVRASLGTVSENIRHVFGQEAQIASFVPLFSTQNLFTIGRVSQAGVALEAALKLKEVAYVHAEGQDAGELKHGSLALIEPNVPTIAFLQDSPSGRKTLTAIEEIVSRNGSVLAIGPATILADAAASHRIEVPSVHTLIQSLVNIIPTYLLTYHLALQKGLPIDRPRNLAKSVTVE